MPGRQRGVSAIFIAVILILVAAAVLALLALTHTSTDVDRSYKTTEQLAKIGAALEQFASASERLPCPADPALDTGDAVPNSGVTACSFPSGTVPWRTIGLRREDALDAWGWKISYRVYSGNTGLTQDGGASMVHCDTIEPAPAGPTANGLCRATHDTTPAQFLAGKGLGVNDFGNAIADAAYVLISHGTTGLGAYTGAGMQKQPLPASTDETTNLAAAGPFVARAAVSTVSAEDPTHFDDVLFYRHLADFVRRANLAARDWPDPGTFADLTFNSATVGAALGSTPSYGSTGQSTINFQNATVSGLGAGSTTISFETSAGTEGIGVMGGSSGTVSAVSSDAGEGLRFDLYLKARQLAVTFNDFGRLTGTPGNPREEAQFAFFDGATQVFSVVKQGCKPDGGLASFVIDAGVDFDHVEIRALTASDGTSRSQFFVSQFLTCAAGATCTTSMSTPGNTCP